MCSGSRPGTGSRCGCSAATLLLAYGHEVPHEDRDRMTARLREVLDRIEEAPKPRGWRLRAKIGERKRWDELPEEMQ